MVFLRIFRRKGPFCFMLLALCVFILVIAWPQTTITIQFRASETLLQCFIPSGSNQTEASQNVPVTKAKPTKPSKPIKPSKTIKPTTPTTTVRPCNYSVIEEYLTNVSYVSTKSRGGLGNRLFIYASAYGIAAYNNRTLLFDEDNLLLKYFNISVPLVPEIEYECLRKNYSNKRTKHDCSFDSKMFDLPKDKNADVGHYMQSYKYFQHVGDEIRSEFSIKQIYLDKAEKIIEQSVSTFHKRKKSKPGRPVLIGVHIRRGNFLNHTFGYDVATPQYMDKATNYYRTKYGNVLFLVCSNGMDWAKQYIKGDDVVYLQGNEYYIDMAVLVSCDHTVATVGSFSWWAGYLTGGDVTYYQWPAKKGTKLRKHFSNDFKDFFPSSWIGLS